ncbi:MAG: glycosyltransferase [Muribaculaceae bacterium]|nr:glycosyltransferase [Muribaculaceae bacterium]
MKLSVITASLNTAAVIERTLQSLDEQKFQDWEYIVVDGNSTDGTCRILEQWQQRMGERLRWVSEPDAGIYDAMNKGIAMARGDAIGFLGAGDTFYDEIALSIVAKELQKREVDAVYGDLVYVYPDDMDRVWRYWRGSQYRPGIFSRGWQPAHPTFFARRKCFRELGDFDKDLVISADFDLMFRFLEKHQISNYYVPRTLVRMLAGGTSNRSVRNVVVAHRNIYRSFRKYGYKVPTLYSVRRLIPKVLNMIENYFSSK